MIQRDGSLARYRVYKRQELIVGIRFVLNLAAQPQGSSTIASHFTKANFLFPSDVTTTRASLCVDHYFPSFLYSLESLFCDDSYPPRSPCIPSICSCCSPTECRCYSCPNRAPEPIRPGRKLARDCRSIAEKIWIPTHREEYEKTSEQCSSSYH
jgi:hypothetical protein